MDILNSVTGLLGLAVGVLSIWYATSGTKQRLIGLGGLAVGGAAAFCLAFAAVGANAKLERVNSTARQAKALLAQQHSKFTNKGFVLASLSFLEAHKEDFPDTYRRGVVLCDNLGCMKPEAELQDSYNSVDAAFAMSSLLNGLAIMTEE